MTTCTNCDAPCPPGIHLCATDTARLESVLGQIPDALKTARATIARLDVTGSQSGGSGGPKIPVNLTAAEYADDLIGKTTSWARLILEDDPDADGLRNVEPAVYLRMSIPIIRANDWAGDLLTELDGALRHVVRVVDVPPEIRTLGPCVTDECPGIIRARKGDSVATCRECGERYDVNAIQQWKISEAWEERAPLAAVVKALNAVDHPIRHATARKWVERGKLVADAAGLFTMAEVYHVHRTMKEKVRAG